MSLRDKVQRGGVYMFLRQGLGVALNAAGMILLVRIIGPAAYGLYEVAFGIYMYLFSLSRWGTDVYLIRHEVEPQPEDYHQAFSLLLLLSLAGMGSAFLAVPLLEHWVQLEGLGPVAVAMFATLPVQLLGLVPLAQLERALDYRRVAWIELSGLMIIYVVALPLAYAGLGYWALVAGWWTRQVFTLGLLYWISDYRPRLYWESTRVRSMLGYGLGYSGSMVWQLRTLVNPLVVSRYAGAEAVGYVALAIRLAEQLYYVIVAVAWRLSIAAFARLQGDRARLVRAVTEGISLQVMIVGSLLAGFGLVAPWILPPLLGDRWLPVLEIYPFIALGYLANSMFTIQSSALQVLRRNWEVVIYNLVHVVIFAGAALLLVPQLGFKGYGWAEVVALPSHILLVVLFVVRIGRPGYMQAGIWFTAWAIPLFSWQLGYWTWICVIAPLIWPATRGELMKAVAMLLSSTRRQ